MDIEMHILGEKVEVGRILKYAFLRGGSRWDSMEVCTFRTKAIFFARKDL